MSLTPACSAGALAHKLAIVEDQLCLYPVIRFHIGCFDEQKPRAFGPANAVLAAQIELGRLVETSCVKGTDGIDLKEPLGVADLFRTHEEVLDAESCLHGSMDRPSLTELRVLVRCYIVSTIKWTDSSGDSRIDFEELYWTHSQIRPLPEEVLRPKNRDS